VATAETTAPAMYAQGRLMEPAVLRKSAFRAGLMRC
jgi:hypothetical protein